jgi:hypothetical protein
MGSHFENCKRQRGTLPLILPISNGQYFPLRWRGIKDTTPAFCTFGAKCRPSTGRFPVPYSAIDRRKRQQEIKSSDVALNEIKLKLQWRQK